MTGWLPERLPRLVCPLKDEYVHIGDIIGKYYLYSMTRKEFIKLAMQHSHGVMNPARVSVIYDNLMEEAGLPPLEDE